jgi:hypothetical protein
MLVGPMLKRGLRYLAWLAICISHVAAAAETADSVEEEGTIGLDALYSLPSIIGTAPERYTWSADASRLAFLWNDEGLAFRDLWVCEMPRCRPRRMTNHASQAPENSHARGVDAGDGIAECACGRDG